MVLVLFLNLHGNFLVVGLCSNARLTGAKGLAKIRNEVTQAKLFASFVEAFVMSQLRKLWIYRVTQSNENSLRQLYGLILLHPGRLMSQ